MSVKPKILIVDDIPENLLVLEKILKKVDADVIKAQNGNLALAATLEHNFALIILDVQMPEMDGYEVAEILKSDERTASLPIIFVTAIDRNEAKELKGYDTGAVDFIFKPLNEFILLCKVRVFLELYRMRSSLEEMVETRTAELSREMEEHKSVRQQLQIVKNYLIGILQSMPSILISIDKNGIVHNWNANAEKFSGILEAQAVGRSIWELTPHFKQFRQAFEQLLIEKQPLTLNNQHLGDKKFYNVSLFPVLVDESEDVVLRFDDVTELRDTEMQLEQAQKMETVGTLAGGLAHDFNNMMNGITGTLSIIRFKINRNKLIAPEELDRYLQIMEDSSQRTIDLIQHLLSLSRKNETNFQQLDLNMVMRHVSKICVNTFDKKIKINTIYSDEYAAVNGDLTQLEQVFLNLCVNGYHAMTIMQEDSNYGEGMLELTINKIRPDKHKIKINPYFKDLDYWCLTVSDTGIGVPEEIRHKIFDPFFTTKEKGKGTGLGLTMVYNIVKQHLGLIELDSEKGRGSIFKVWLPVLHTNSVANTPKAAEEIKSGSGTILIIDDESVIQNLAAEILTGSGYQIISAYDGLEGIEKYRTDMNSVNLVLLDLVMPKLSGKEVYFELKKINPAVKIIMCSGFKNDPRIDEVRNHGLKHFIQKPFTYEILANTVWEVLNEDKSVKTD